MADWEALAAFLSTPVNADELAKAVRALIELKRFDSADALLSNISAGGGIPQPQVADLRNEVKAMRLIK
jgi:hypothetical protein